MEKFRLFLLKQNCKSRFNDFRPSMQHVSLVYFLQTYVLFPLHNSIVKKMQNCYLLMKILFFFLNHRNKFRHATDLNCITFVHQEYLIILYINISCSRSCSLLNSSNISLINILSDFLFCLSSFITFFSRTWTVP